MPYAQAHARFDSMNEIEDRDSQAYERDNRENPEDHIPDAQVLASLRTYQTLASSLSRDSPCLT
jgi:hypothetical protein